MALTEILAAISAFKAVIEIWEKIKSSLPDTPEIKELTTKLAEAKKAAALAEAQAAQSLGYELCCCTWPPQIMLYAAQESPADCPTFLCPNCKRIEIPTGEKFDKLWG